MKTDVTRYQTNQIYLLNNGAYVFIASTDPLTKFHSDERSRTCYCKVGHSRRKGDEFKNGHSVVLEDAGSNVAITIDCSKNQNFTMEELRNREAMYIGTVSEEKVKLIQKMSADTHF